MELLRPSATTKPNFFAAFSPSSSLVTLHNKTRLRFHKPIFKPFPNLFATNSHLPNCKTPRITARFGRPTNRRNSLRKKLAHDLQVRQNPPKIIDSSDNSVDYEAFRSNLGNNSLEQGDRVMGTDEIDSASNNIENSKQLGDSVLWDKLDTWVEQYQKDIHFWGIGSYPIFTVFRDSDGNVERVFVDEDEILRRSGLEPLYYREERELEASAEVNSKIAHAKYLAREIESGKDVVPKNSSVVKFVANAETSGFVSRIMSFSVPTNLMPNASRAGIAVVCAFLSVWALKKLFNLGRGEMEGTKFEKEMLRRKIKARMVNEKEKENSQKGSVEVVDGPLEQPNEFMERPQLDKDKLLDSIRKAKGLGNELPVLNDASAQDVASVRMDAKICEIQKMARHARKIEKEDRSEIDDDHETDNQGLSQLPQKQDITEEPMDPVNSDSSNSLASNVSAIEKDNGHERTEGHGNLVDNVADGSFTKPDFVNGITKTEVLGGEEPKSDGINLTSEKSFEGIGDVKLQSSSSGKIIVGDSSQTDGNVDDHSLAELPALADGCMLSEVSSSQQTMKLPVRRKPKVILSVSEAREYLSKKQEQKPQIRDIPTSININNGGIDNSTTQRLGEDGKAPESSSVNGVLDTVANDCESYSVKENGHLSTQINGVNKEIQITSMHNRPSESEVADISSIGTEPNVFSREKIDGISEHRNASDMLLDIFPDKNTFSDSGLMKEEYRPSEQEQDKADKLDEMRSPSNLAEMSDHVLGNNACGKTGSPSEMTIIPDNNVTYDVYLKENRYSQTEKSLVEANAIYEMLMTGDASEASALVADGNGLYDYASEENAILQDGMVGDTAFGNSVEGRFPTFQTSKGSKNGEEEKEGGAIADKGNWLEENFHELEPLVKKIDTGFKSNYMTARENVKEKMDTGFDFMKLRSMKDDTELEWMKDGKLRDIVFRVRDNELAGRDPFHSMDPEDKVAFFRGLEQKVEKENEKLAVLHEWLHSNIENIDYGADGISLYDPPDKVIPRWKGPPIDRIPEFLLSNAAEQQEASSLQKVDESRKQDNNQMSEESSITKSNPKKKVTKTAKTVIEASDGSIKPGKRSRKEFWEQTKKLSPGFMESYNAESDPEVKSVMKDIGKDLDRWITEKEIQEAAEVMDKIPQRGKEIIEKKLNKVKREMELFGPAAVVSKYREYAEEKEEDYLWWLDLAYVLCIEMYVYEGDEQKVGFYALEMATDLDIDPKPNHVIAFQDPGDCKNICYIIQAHLEMLGRGQAFVVAQTPKDAFREAKANGFGVTVIRKGELQLNIDQPLEDVEELITGIGSKMYHDKLMKERSVDISALMKGVFGISEPSKRRRRKKRALKKPKKP